MEDTLYKLLGYAKPKHNIIFGSGFLLNKLFTVEYDNTIPIRYLNIKPAVRNCINYEGPFHVFISTNTGLIRGVADVEDKISIDISSFMSPLSDSIYLPEGRIIVNNVNIHHKCYGLFIDSQLNTVEGLPVKTLYIIFLTKKEEV